LVAVLPEKGGVLRVSPVSAFSRGPAHAGRLLFSEEAALKDLLLLGELMAITGIFSIVAFVTLRTGLQIGGGLGAGGAIIDFGVS
jgi:hypothetical protein